eukprot:CAMPEP_0180100676 /NCGR_PEP_ID=MMETSP0985-20121206/29057_1 /TAXON_ID=483367 /ORGANISM="non described non described, Strain CCMP 2436" /LENGTH=182 /DNA_ID=CAMNT_0022036491 /DNA_START=102 /DNA_END=651 /DNA_ORIENTATION=+
MAQRQQSLLDRERRARRLVGGWELERAAQFEVEVGSPVRQQLTVLRARRAAGRVERRGSAEDGAILARAPRDGVPLLPLGDKLPAQRPVHQQLPGFVLLPDHVELAEWQHERSLVGGAHLHHELRLGARAALFEPVRHGANVEADGVEQQLVRLGQLGRVVIGREADKGYVAAPQTEMRARA